MALGVGTDWSGASWPLTKRTYCDLTLRVPASEVHSLLQGLDLMQLESSSIQLTLQEVRIALKVHPRAQTAVSRALVVSFSLAWSTRLLEAFSLVP